MLFLLQLTTKAGGWPLSIHVDHILCIGEQPYYTTGSNDSDMAVIVSLISGKEYVVAESYEMVLQQWQEALGEHADDENGDDEPLWHTCPACDQPIRYGRERDEDSQ